MRERRRGRANGAEGSEDAELRVEGLTHAEMGENAPPEAGEAEETDCLPEPSWGAQPCRGLPFRLPTCRYARSACELFLSHQIYSDLRQQ